MITSLKKFFSLNNIGIDLEELEFQLSSHPAYPSLYALSSVLDHFYIPNLALELSRDNENLMQLPTSFFALVSSPEGQKFTLVLKKNEFLVINNKKISNSDFLKNWLGVVLLIDSPKEEIQKTKGKNIYQHLSLIILGALSIILFLYQIQEVKSFSYFILSITITYLSYMVLSYHYGEKSPIVEKICKGGAPNSKIDCDLVLNSAVGRLGKYHFSDLLFIYSFGTVLISIFYSISGETHLNILGMISILACFVTAFSIFIQAFVVKKWCKICLVIIAIIWIQTSISSISFHFSLFDILIGCFGFAISNLVWIFIAKKMKSTQMLRKIKIDFTRFKRNYGLFKLALFAEKSYPKTQIPNEIILGSKDEYTPRITIITNPLCGHCVDVHHVVEEILSKFSEKIQVIIRFNVNPNPKDKSTQISAKLIELYQKSENDCVSAMNEIYSKNSDSMIWLEKYGLPNNKGSFEVLKNENKWCQEQKLNFTPVIIVNGRKYPGVYERRDLLFHIEEIIDEFTSNKEVEVAC